MQTLHVSYIFVLSVVFYINRSYSSFDISIDAPLHAPVECKQPLNSQYKDIVCTVCRPLFLLWSIEPAAYLRWTGGSAGCADRPVPRR